MITFVLRYVPLNVLTEVESAGNEVGKRIGVLGILVESLEQIPLSLFVITLFHVANGPSVVEGGLHAASQPNLMHSHKDESPVWDLP